MVHGTAREFLLNEDLESEFAINKTEAHTRIARVYLKYLTGEEMKPRTTRRGSAMNTAGKRAGFSVYVCAAFSYHLAKARPQANDVFVLVDKFWGSNVLSWIEVIAQTRNLNPLIRAAKNLRKYLHSCAAEISPLGRSCKGSEAGRRISFALFPNLLMLPQRHPQQSTRLSCHSALLDL